jgi:hypothetical protein
MSNVMGKEVESVGDEVPHKELGVFFSTYWIKKHEVKSHLYGRNHASRRLEDVVGIETGLQ